MVEKWIGIIYMETEGYSKEDMDAVMETVKSEIDSKLDEIKVVSCDVIRVL